MIWREIVGKEICKVEEVTEMEGDSDLARDSWKKRIVRRRRLMRLIGIVIGRELVGKDGCKVEEVNEIDGDSDLERDSWKRGL